MYKPLTVILHSNILKCPHTKVYVHIIVVTPNKRYSKLHIIVVTPNKRYSKLHIIVITPNKWYTTTVDFTL